MQVSFSVVVFAVMGLISSSVYAQSKMPPEFTEDSSPTVVIIDLDDTIDQFLSSKGWSRGLFNTKSGKKAFSAIGRGTIQANRSNKNFIASREIAFQKAVLAAKKELVEYLGTEISTSLTSEYQEPDEKRQLAAFEEAKRQGVALQASGAVASTAFQDFANQAAEDGMGGYSNTAQVVVDQSEILMKQELDKKLKDMGLDPNQPIAQQTLNSITSQEDFKRVINAVAKSRISGIQVYKTWEYLPEGEKGSIAVLLIQSARLVKLADSIFSGTAALAPGTVNGKQLSSQLPQDKKVLIGTFGVQFKKNENNKWCLVSYGQAQPRNKNPRALIAAQDKGALNAKGMIRQFAGEIAKSSANKQDSESATDLADETEKYDYDENYAEKMQTFAGKLNIAGMSTIKRWKAKHPLTGNLVAGAVVSWCPGAMQNALSMKETMKAPPQTTNLGVVNNQQSGNQQVPPHQSNQGNYFAAGAEADDDF